MNRLICFSLILFSLMGSMNAQSTNPKDITVGKWTNDDKSAQIRFYAKNDRYFGTLHLLKNVDAVDKNNTNRSLRSRKLEGITIISNLVYADGQYTGGTIYSPEKGLTVNCTIEWIDKNTLSVKGYKGIISKTLLWKR